MDPNEALERLLSTARCILGGEAGDMFDESADELAEQVLALDEWLRKGGFLPSAWQRSGGGVGKRKLRMPRLDDDGKPRSDGGAS